MLNLENSFFKFLQESLAQSFSDRGFGVGTLHLKVWKSPNIPFMWNMWVWRLVCRNTLSGLPGRHNSVCSHLLEFSGLEIFCAWSPCTESQEFTAESGTKKGLLQKSSLWRGGRAASVLCCPPATCQAEESYWAALHPCWKKINPLDNSDFTRSCYSTQLKIWLSWCIVSTAFMNTYIN